VGVVAITQRLSGSRLSLFLSVVFGRRAEHVVGALLPLKKKKKNAVATMTGEIRARVRSSHLRGTTAPPALSSTQQLPFQRHSIPARPFFQQEAAPAFFLL
jgi:hypothetical protein